MELFNKPFYTWASIHIGGPMNKAPCHKGDEDQSSNYYKNLNVGECKCGGKKFECAKCRMFKITQSRFILKDITNYILLYSSKLLKKGINVCALNEALRSASEGDEIKPVDFE